MRSMKRFILLLALVACSTDPVPLDLADEPATLSAVSATEVASSVGASVPVAVRVTDAQGRPVPAVAVRFAPSAGSVDADSSDADGLAQGTWTMPEEPGFATLTVSVDGVDPVIVRASVSPVSSGNVVFRFLDAGSYHACGITTTEQLLCWGYNADGQLGLGAGEPRPVPNLIPGDQRYRIVSGGRYHSCGITLAGQAMCWGDNRDGKASPPTAPSFRSISSGRVHTCGLSLANELFCWGWGREGQTAVGGYGWSSVNVNGLHSCAITSGGEAQCWGYNESGQLGRGTITVQEPLAVVSGGASWRTDPTVVPPPPDPEFPLPSGPFIGTGFAHSCALRSDGAAFCWGTNQDGQLGDGTATQRVTPQLVGGGLNFARITTGDRHTCALTSDGTAYCWGDNAFGQLGDGSTRDRLAPTTVAGDLTFAYHKAGELFTCGVTTAGTAYCWGDNEYGQLGIGNTTGSNVPVKVAFQP
jgi:alpha-tubulin suppressor-like RCC1 family protein